MDFVIEVARGDLAKRSPAGRVEFASPIPCPFNYGSAPGHPSADGEPADVVVLGPRRPRGSRGSLPVVARVRFIDAGLPDDKWVCSDRPLRRRDLARLRAFFTTYAWIKRWSAPLRGVAGEARVVAIERLEGGPSSGPRGGSAPGHLG